MKFSFDVHRNIRLLHTYKHVCYLYVFLALVTTCQPRTFIVNVKKGDLVADSHSIMTRWRNYFSQLLNVHGAKDVRQAEIHTAEPLVPEPSAFEFELAIEKLKSHITRY